MKITTGLVGNENASVRQARLKDVTDFWFGSGSYVGAGTLGGVRALLNSLPVADIANREDFGTWLTKFNLMNDTSEVMGALFGAGSVGLNIDAGEHSTLFQDAAGTIAVTGPGQPVGMVSGPANAVQSVSAARPTLGRHPRSGWRNRAVGAQAVASASYWVSSGVSNGLTYTKVGTGVEDGIPYVDIRVSGTATATEHGVGWSDVNSQIAMTTGSAIASVTARVIAGTAPSGSASAGIRLILTERDAVNAGIGTVSRSTAANNATDTVIVQSKAAVTSGVAAIRAAMIVETGATEVVDVTYRIKGLQFEAGSTVTALQHNLGPYDMTEPGQGDAWYIKPDGIDDFLETGSVTWGTDEVTVIAAVMRLQSDVTTDLVGLSATPGAAGGKFALSPTSDAASTNAGFASSGDTANALARAGSTPINSAIILTGMGKISTDQCLIRRNGVQIQSVSADQGAGLYNPAKLFIGARGGASRFFSGHIYGLLAINRLLNPTELALAERWMARKCGVTLP